MPAKTHDHGLNRRALMLGLARAGTHYPGLNPGASMGFEHGGTF